MKFGFDPVEVRRAVEISESWRRRRRPVGVCVRSGSLALTAAEAALMRLEEGSGVRGQRVSGTWTTGASRSVSAEHLHCGERGNETLLSLILLTIRNTSSL